MSFFSLLDPSVTFDADLGIIDTNTLALINAFGASQDVTYISADDNDGLLQSGEGATVTTDDGSGGTTLYDLTYLGDSTLTTSDVILGSVSGPLATGVRIQVNPIEGELFQEADGSLGFVSNEPVNDARLGLTVTTYFSGIETTVQLELSQLDAYLDGFPLLGPVLDGITDMGQYVLDTAVVSMDFDAAGTLIVCFARETRILTRAGSIPIEDLKVGDKVFTRDNGYQQISWIGSRKLSAQHLRLQPELRPIRIRAGALGNESPSTDLLVSPQHRILVCSNIAQRMFGRYEVLVAAKQLLGCEGIEIAEDVEEVEYFHFLMQQHEVVFSNGAPTESLYTGAQALMALGSEAVEEIRKIFPGLVDPNYRPSPARYLPSGRRARRLGERHRLNNRPLFVPRSVDGGDSLERKDLH